MPSLSRTGCSVTGAQKIAHKHIPQEYSSLYLGREKAKKVTGVFVIFSK